MMNRLILVDGMACVYRSFYAVKGLSTADGSPVNALYGFILQLESVLRQLKPSHIGVLFDGGLSDERTAILPEYKAQRPPMPDELRSQLPLINEFLDAVGMYWFLGEGVEADDAIAAMAWQFADEAEETYVVTSDKDMFQLINDKVTMLLPGKDKRFLDADGVVEKTGVAPSQIVDWLAMVGDASDNIQGVPGVGAKTAAKLLQEYGSLEGIMQNVDSISREKTRASLIASKDILKRNVDLITLKDVNCGVDEQELVYKPHFGAGLEAFLTRMEFGSLVDGLREGHFLR